VVKLPFHVAGVRALEPESGLSGWLAHSVLCAVSRYTGVQWAVDGRPHTCRHVAR